MSENTSFLQRAQWEFLYQYSGSVVAGLCLLSPAIMTMRHKDDSNIRFDVLLEPGTFYIQRQISHISFGGKNYSTTAWRLSYFLWCYFRDTIRYSFTHEIRLSNTTWKGNEVDRSRRISLLFRVSILIGYTFIRCTYVSNRHPTINPIGQEDIKCKEASYADVIIQILWQICCCKFQKAKQTIYRGCKRWK